MFGTRWFFLFLFLSFFHSAWAFKLTPMTSVFRPGGPEATQTFSIENEGAEKIAVQISMAQRKMDLHGNETHPEADDDFVVYPSQVILQPKSRRSVRITWVSKKAVMIELPYRIIAEQLAIEGLKPKKTRGAAIDLLLKYEGSVYIRPNNVKPEVIVEKVEYKQKKGKEYLLIDLWNRGTAHQLLNDPVLKVSSDKSNIELKVNELTVLNGQNVLAKSKRRFLIPWPKDLKKIKLKAEIKVKSS